MIWMEGGWNPSPLQNNLTLQHVFLNGPQGQGVAHPLAAQLLVLGQTLLTTFQPIAPPHEIASVGWAEWWAV